MTGVGAFPKLNAGAVRGADAAAGAAAGAADAVGVNSSAGVCAPSRETVMTPPHTAQRARTSAPGILAGSTRKTDRHSGQETFTVPLPARRTRRRAPRLPPARRQVRLFAGRW